MEKLPVPWYSVGSPKQRPGSVKFGDSALPGHPQRAFPGKSQNGRKEEKAPAQRAAAQRRGNMEKSVETREQTLKKIEYNLPKLTDAQLRLVSAFIRGIVKGQ